MGVNAYAGRIQDFIATRPAGHPPYDVIFLDLTSSLPPLLSTIRALFKNHLISSDTVLAVTTSTRASRPLPQFKGMPEDWSRAHAAYTLFSTLITAAESHGYTIKPALPRYVH
eukprot:CAMPEP_0167800972 /NCGR_PEP_ID=MMETSP0111_2-20121227/18112_1 /TAXON_ID=91324 /ORGANISM="Lotharella globosa, Strain CCCM811" /LENGTH=112 /DNA_ID=CAMNT_0007696459 /DNA_START=135 /DNA_END=470 /DNA_ORIENTATION=+